MIKLVDIFNALRAMPALCLTHAIVAFLLVILLLLASRCYL